MNKKANKKINKATVTFNYEASESLRKRLYDAGLPAQAEQQVSGEFTEDQLALINIVPCVNKRGDLEWTHGIAPTRLEVALRPVIAGKGFFGSYDNSVFVSNELLTADQAATIQAEHFKEFLKVREIKAAEKALAETLAYADFVEFMADPALRAASKNNPRELPCPNCGAENVLTQKDRQLGYQCDGCADNQVGDRDIFEFAEPGGRSALRAASKNNPRELPCPNCGAENVLTQKDRQLGYQCDGCADQAEGGYGY